jgi:hypothetical protein
MGGDDMSGATTTPVDRSHEAPIRDEIRRVNHAIESLQKSFGPLFDALSERLAHRLDADRDDVVARLDAFFAKADTARREDAAAVKLLIEEAESRTDEAILEAHLHFSKEIVRVDGRIDDLDLRVGAHVGDNEREAAHTAGVTTVLIKRVDEHESFLSRYRQPIAASAGSTGLTLAIVHLAPLLWELFKTKAGIP